MTVRDKEMGGVSTIIIGLGNQAVPSPTGNVTQNNL